MARLTMDGATFDRKYHDALMCGDGLSLLLQAKERCDATAEEIDRARGRAPSWDVVCSCWREMTALR